MLSLDPMHNITCAPLFSIKKGTKYHVYYLLKRKYPAANIFVSTANYLPTHPRPPTKKRQKEKKENSIHCNYLIIAEKQKHPFDWTFCILSIYVRKKCSERSSS